MPTVSDGVHSSVKAIQNMEVACARFARTLVEQLPEVKRALRQVTDGLEERHSNLRREIASLDNQIASAEEDDDVSWERQRVEEARDELTSVRRGIRRLADVSANYTRQARKVEHLATDHTVAMREFLNGAADDLKTYIIKADDGGLGRTGAFPADKILSRLTSAEKQALHRYTGHEFEEINKALRDGLQNDAVLRVAALVSQALAKLPIYQGTVYRGITLDDNALSKYVPGNIVTENQFLSSSTRQDIAEQFGKLQPRALFTIQSKSGKSIAGVSEYAHESEILFDKGTQFKVSNRELIYGVWQITEEEL